MLAWLGVASSLSSKTPSDSSSGGVAAFIAVPCLEWGCSDHFKTNGFFLAHKCTFSPIGNLPYS